MVFDGEEGEHEEESGDENVDVGDDQPMIGAWFHAILIRTSPITPVSVPERSSRAHGDFEGFLVSTRDNSSMSFGV